MDLRTPHPCEICGTLTESVGPKDLPSRFCSKRCYREARRAVHLFEYTCNSCSNKWTVQVDPYHTYPAYCSDDCRKEAARVRSQRWYKNNPEKVAMQPSRESAHRAVTWAAYYEAHREEQVERALKYARDHPEWKRARDSARYAVTRGATEAEQFTLDEIYERDQGVCYLCNRGITRKRATADHVIPVVMGGPHTRTNVRLACRSCNSRKRQQLVPAGYYADNV